jgi:hypothetical protein
VWTIAPPHTAARPARQRPSDTVSVEPADDRERVRVEPSKSPNSRFRYARGGRSVARRRLQAVDDLIGSFGRGNVPDGAPARQRDVHSGATVRRPCRIDLVPRHPAHARDRDSHGPRGLRARRAGGHRWADASALFFGVTAGRSADVHRHGRRSGDRRPRGWLPAGPKRVAHRPDGGAPRRMIRRRLSEQRSSPTPSIRRLPVPSASCK